MAKSKLCYPLINVLILSYYPLYHITFIYGMIIYLILYITYIQNPTQNCFEVIARYTISIVTVMF